MKSCPENQTAGSNESSSSRDHIKVRTNMIFTGPSVTVGVSMYVLSISRLSEVDMVMLAKPIITKKNLSKFSFYIHLSLHTFLFLKPFLLGSSKCSSGIADES